MLDSRTASPFARVLRMALALETIVMTWSRLFYGSESPTSSKRILYNVLAGAFLICWYGMKSEFVASSWWLRWGSAASVFVSIALAPVFCRLCLQALGSASDSHLERWILCSAAYALLLLIVWTGVVRTSADLVTRWTAPKITVQAGWGVKHRQFGRRSCHYQIRGDFFRFQPFGYACVSSSDFDQLPERGFIQIEGEQSAFGIHIGNVQPSSANKLPDPTLETNAAQQ